MADLTKEQNTYYTRPKGVMGGPCLHCQGSQPEHVGLTCQQVRENRRKGIRKLMEKAVPDETLTKSKPEVPSSKRMSIRERVASRAVQNVCELPGYTSPDDQPDLVMCTVQELEACVLSAFEHIEECSADETSTHLGWAEEERKCLLQYHNFHGRQMPDPEGAAHRARAAQLRSVETSEPRPSTMDYGGVGQVGCEGDDGLLRVHGYNQTCDVCAPEKASERPAPGGSSYVVACARCPASVTLTGSNGRVSLSGGAGWYFSTDTGWLCPSDAPH
jgi:hypothetical protein